MPAGFALWFQTFSTWTGRPGLWLEDLFVWPDYRRRGIGRALLVYLARLCLERNYSRFEWSVLDWNTPAIDFYRSLGASRDGRVDHASADSRTRCELSRRSKTRRQGASPLG